MLIDDLNRAGSGERIPLGPGPLRNIAEALGSPYDFRYDRRLQKAINVSLFQIALQLRRIDPAIGGLGVRHTCLDSGLAAAAEVEAKIVKRVANSGVADAQPWRAPDAQAGSYALGMLGLDERRLLYHLARNSYTGEGSVVELGAFCGASTCCLAAGLRDNPLAPVVGLILLTTLLRASLTWSIFYGRSSVRR